MKILNAIGKAMLGVLIIKAANVIVDKALVAIEEAVENEKVAQTARDLKNV